MVEQQLKQCYSLIIKKSEGIWQNMPKLAKPEESQYK